MTNAPQIADLINAKRASGYDGEFEALMRQPWYCPNCKASKTILDTVINITIPGSPMLCRDCRLEGINHIAGDGTKQFRKMLNALAPFNRSGTA